MSQRRILLITYYFPPLGGAGIGRPLALFQNLSSHNYECHVLTVKPVLYRAYEPELLEELDKSKIFRAGSSDPSRLLYILGVRNVSAKAADDSRVFSRRFFPDAKAGWIKPAIRMGKKLIKTNGYDLIVSTSPPISAHVIAKELSLVSGIPWVGDFRDYWTSVKAEDYFDSDAKRQKAKQLLDEIKSTAKSIIAVNESVAKYVGAESVITNCYDSKLVKLWRMPSNRPTFTIGVFGTISGLTPIQPLLEVLRTVKRNRPEVYTQVKVLQVGQVDFKWLKRKINEYELGDIFDISRYQTRTTAVELLSEAAMFYVGVSPDQGFGLTTNRIFTLMSSGRPILAYALKGSELERVMAHSDHSFCFDDTSIDEAGSYLSQMAGKFLKGDMSIDIEPEAVREFSSDRMVEKFAGFFDRVLAEK